MLTDHPRIPLPVVCKMESTESQSSVSTQKNAKMLVSKQPRSTNFNSNESLKLEELVKQNFEVLNSKLTNQVTNNKKGEIWKDISRQVSALGYAYRSEKTCMEKWANMKRKAKEEVTKEKIERRKTGGGTVPGACDQSNRISDLFSESSSFHGIDGGLDTDDPDSLHFISNTAQDGEEQNEPEKPEKTTSQVNGCNLLSLEKQSVTGCKRPSGGKLSNSVKRHRSRSDMLVDYQIQYFRGMVERQDLERELLEVKLRVLKSAEKKLDELNARELLDLISEQ